MASWSKPPRVKQTHSFCSFSYVSMVRGLSHLKRRRRAASEVQAGQTKVVRKKKKKRQQYKNLVWFLCSWMKVQSDVGCPSLLWIANWRAAAQLCCWRLWEVKRELFYGSLAVAKLLPFKLRWPSRGPSCSGRLITSLVSVVSHQLWWRVIEAGVFATFFNFPRVAYNILRHQRHSIDLASVKLWIAWNFLRQ